MKDYREEVIQKSYEYIDKANALYNLNIVYPEILFNLKGVTAGIAYYNPLRVRYNQFLLNENTQEFISTTVPHETAHIVEFVKYGRCGHKENWKGIMRAFGITNPQRCHDFNTAYCRRKSQQYIYTCGCMEHRFGKKLHERLKYDSFGYTCKKCHNSLKYLETVLV